MTEIVEDAKGSPYQFRAERGDLRQAIATIPAETLLEANRAQWTSRGLEPPKMTAAGLRKRLLAKHEKAATRPDDLVLPIEEAARHVGLTGRVLRYRLQQGEFAEHTRPLPGGQTGLVFAPPARRWSLVVERPDPRVLVLMVHERCQPGERHRLGYTRRRDGEYWRAANRW